ncbi:MAG TPA: hypothetical protein PKA05_18830, partial [Roseiflexaceae bacterium]|nr:hypothetical protein [Roseiflexaceae bacterium]
VTLIRELERRGLTIRQQADLFGLKQSTYTGRRYRLISDGFLPKRGQRGKDWSPMDEDRLLSLVDQGYGYDDIALRLKRTRLAIILKCRRLQVSITTTNATLSARDIAVLLGKKCGKSVTRWIRLRWLRARNAAPKGSAPLWRIQWDDLLEFMERREHWMAWEADAVTDACLREWSQELRAAAGGRWLRPGEVARQLHVDHRAVNKWIATGIIRAARYGNWWIWSRDLDGFVVPCERPRGKRAAHGTD